MKLCSFVIYVKLSISSNCFCKKHENKLIIWPLFPSVTGHPPYLFTHLYLISHHITSHRISSSPHHHLMQTSQELTRFLRGKEGSLDKKVELCNKLVHEELDVFLPNGEIFVLELFCDRLNDTKKEHNDWKLHPQVWHALSHITSTYTEAASRVLRRLKFVEITIAILNQRPEILLFITPVGQFCVDQCILTTDANSSQSMLALVLSAFNQKQFTNKEILPLFISIYQLPRRSTRYKPSKKTTTLFFESCLTPLVQYLSTNEREPVFEQVQHIFISGTFPKEQLPQLKTNIEKALPALSANAARESSIQYLFYHIVARLSRDIALCEEVFLCITTKLPKMTQVLLETLTKANRILSFLFFETLFTQHKQDHILVGCLIDLDASLGVKYANEIAQSLEENDEAVATKLMNAFIKVREYSLFFLDVWLNNANRKDVWRSPQVIDEIALKIPGLTIKSLQDILKGLQSERLVPLHNTIILCILKGLLHCDDSYHIALREDIVNLNIAESSDWQIKYYVSLSYGDEVNIGLTGCVDDMYYYYTVFRQIEIGTSAEAHASRFVKHICSLPPPERDEYLLSTFKRWPKILAHHFDLDNLQKILAAFLKTNDHIAYFRNDAQVYFEEKVLNKQLISFLIESIKKDADTNLIETALQVPVACYERGERSTMIETLLTAEPEKDSSLILSLLDHIIDQPSFATDLETKFSTSVTLIHNFQGNSFEAKAVQIFMKIWHAHADQCNDTVHMDYVTDTIETLTKFLKSKIAVSDAKWIICNAIFNTKRSIYKENIIARLDSFHSFCLAKILTAMKSKYDSSLLQSLKNLSMFKPSSVLADTLLHISDKISNPLLKDRINLFSILCSIEHQRFEQALHILAVYITLLPSVQSIDLDQALSVYCKSLAKNRDHFTRLIQYILFSFDTDSDSESHFIYLRVLACLLHGYDSNKDIIQSVIAIMSSNIDNLLRSEKNIELLLQIIMQQLKSSKIGQYTFEIVVAFVTKVAKSLSTWKFSNAEQTYHNVIQIASELLLFHRIRMSSRHHLIIQMFSSMMEPLSVTGNSQLSLSISAAKSYTRAMSNLCEPKFKAQKIKVLSLNSAVALAKKSLRKHLPGILLSFIHLSLNQRFSDATQDELLYCMSIVFDTISDGELQVVNSSLDVPGRLYMKLIYSRYKENYKWKTT